MKMQLLFRHHCSLCRQALDSEEVAVTACEVFLFGVKGPYVVCIICKQRAPDPKDRNYRRRVRRRLIAIKNEVMKGLFELYGWAREFSEGLAMVVKDEECFHVHPDGTPAYEERFDALTSFHEGLAWAKKGGKYFHIHHDGTPAYEERFDGIDSFHEGFAWAKKGDEWFRINPDGTRYRRQ